MPLQTLWFQLVNTSLCTNMFNGFYTLWLAQLVASFFLFFAMLMASVHWQYFDLDEYGNKPNTGGVAVADAEPVLDVEGGAGGVGGGPMLNQPWVMPDGMAEAGDNKGGQPEVNPYTSVAGQLGRFILMLVTSSIAHTPPTISITTTRFYLLSHSFFFPPSFLRLGLGSKIPSPVPGASTAASPRDHSHTHPPGVPAHNPEYQAKHDLHMAAIEKAANNVVANPHHNPLQLTAEQDDDTLPYR